METDSSPWFASVRGLTEQLVRLRAVSPSHDENVVATAIHTVLRTDEHALAYAAIGLDAVEADPYARNNVYALVRGQRAETIVLLGHFDTVGTEDFGPLEPWATDPSGLARQLDTLTAFDPELPGDLTAHPDDWFFGRGSVDMKAGVAVNIALIRRLAADAAAGNPPVVSVVFLATPDEENESAGVVQAGRFLVRLRAELGLRYLGVLNTDYTTAEYPGDPHRYVYSGTIGKLLPCALVIGRASHVGQPFDGLDANVLAAELIRDVSMDEALCDRVRGQVAPAPVTLRAADLKERYDVQVPFAAYWCLNVLTLETTPAMLLERLRDRAAAALARTLERVTASEARWSAIAGRPPATAARTGIVLTFAELRAEAIKRLGVEQVALALTAAAAALPAESDKRERCARLALRLWTLSELQGPAVVLFYAPPYYPHVAARPGPLQSAVRQVIAAHPELALVEREFYPYISDLSYLGLDGATDSPALTANMPVWRQAGAPQLAGEYILPLDRLSELGLPVVNFGPYGRGAHRPAERVLMSYSFHALPGLLWEVIARSGEHAG